MSIVLPQFVLEKECAEEMVLFAGNSIHPINLPFITEQDNVLVTALATKSEVVCFFENGQKLHGNGQ